MRSQTRGNPTSRADSSTDKKIAIRPLKCAGCLRCQMVCSLNYKGVFSRAEAWIQVDFDSARGKYSAFFTPECTYCGLCVENCAFGCLAYAEEK